MNVSKNGVKLIAGFEGCVLHAYEDAVGVLTIGYGHTAGVKKGDVITQKEADDMLNAEVQRFGDQVEKLIHVPINQNQFDAITSLAYNVGIGNLSKSTLLELVNKKHFTDAKKEFAKWNKAGGHVLAGLVKRRAKESELFGTPVPAPKTSSNVTTSNIHTVKAGETLWGIAMYHHTTADHVKALNHLKSNVIQPGDKLRFK